MQIFRLFLSWFCFSLTTFASQKPTESFDIDRYAAAVAASEMPLAFPAEARIAQEIASRSYYVSAGMPKILNFTELFQVVRPEHRSFQRTAVAPGIIMKMVKGVLPEYHAKCPGMIWDPSTGRTQICPLHQRISDRWKVVIYRSGPLAKIVKRIASSKDLAEKRRLRLPYRDVLKSPFITDIIEVDDQIVVRGVGHGHGVGMCQWGAKFLAERGWDHTRILRYFYGNVDLVRLENVNQKL